MKHQTTTWVKRCAALRFSALFLVSIAAVFVLDGLSVSASNEARPQVASSSQESAIEEARTRAFADFENWVKEYLATAEQESLKARGLELAPRRRSFLKGLIVSDPARALTLAVPPDTRRKLPSEIGQYIEEQISAYGDYLVVVSDEMNPATGKFLRARIDRMVVIHDKVYKVTAYGRWLSMSSKKNIPINGIAIDDVMAVNESPVRVLSTGELAALSASGNLVEGEIAVDIGGEIRYFKSRQDLSAFTQALVSREMMIGPDTEEHKNNLSTGVSGQLTADSAWTEGTKTVLFIRIDFPDRPGEPVDFNNQPLTLTRAQSLMDTQISPFYVSNSYNKTSMQTTVTSVVRMPQPQSFYFSDFGALLTDARNAARPAGFETNNFNLDVLAMSNSQGFPYAGIASVGAKGAALNGEFDVRVTAHELGHNYGLLHANLWRTTDGTVIGNGSNIEYGNPFDVMGCCGDARSHFNAQYKRRLDWLTDANVQTITTDGVYRTFAEDSSTPGGIRGLKIRKSSTKNYWIEFRQLFIDNPNALNGAIINWDYLSVSFRETQLLDMTPNTSTDATDAPLLIGQTFNDNENRIRMTVLGKGNTTPESLDVRVELNVGCSFSLGQTTQSFSASGGAGTITVNTQSGCRPPATSNDSWLYAAPTDTGTVGYIVAANYDSQPRMGTITVAGQTFTVQQGAATTACVAPPSGLVAWWRGEGNALDETGVNNGVLINNMTYGGGKVGGGFLGDYDNNAGVVEVLDSPLLALTHSMTFEGWLKVNSYGGTVIERRTSDFVNSYQVWMLSTGELLFTVWYDNHSGIGVFSDPLPLGQFVHFATSLDDATGQIKMYINGSLVRQFTITQRPNVISGANTSIGNINGTTDELSVYNRALSASEIQVIYNAGTAATGATGKCLLPSSIQINNITPAAGRASGGQQIKLTGAFAGLSTVMIGGVSASWSYTNGTSEVTVTTPPHTSGAVNIDLTPTAGSPYSKSNAFAYLPTVFTDDTLMVQVTTAKAQHILELRQAVDALRVVAGLGPAPWTDPALSPFSTLIKAVHITELRSSLENAAALLGYPAGSYTDPGLGSGIVIKRVHIEELRQRIRNIAG